MTTDSSTPTVARTITASEFKTRCLKLMDEVTETGDEVVITKKGKPVAKLSPYRKKPKSLFGIDRGRYEITGDPRRADRHGLVRRDTPGQRLNP